jgi:azurin
MKDTPLTRNLDERRLVGTHERSQLEGIVMKKILALCVFALFSGAVMADDCKVEISGNDQMQYDKKELKVSSTCKEVTVTLHHAGKLPKTTMGHGWNLAKTSDYQALAQAGVAAGPTNNYTPPGDARVIASVPIVGGGETHTITFSTAKMQKGGDYTFFCPFPGHFATMHGKFIFD